MPWAPLWAALAAVLQIVPHLGPVLSLVGPVLVTLLRWQDWEHPLYVLTLYAVIVVVDGLLLQPYIILPELAAGTVMTPGTVGDWNGIKRLPR